MQQPEKSAAGVLSALPAPGGGFRSVELYGPAVQKGAAGAPYTAFPLENESGTGRITVYPAFPGIELVYNDMHMAYCNKAQAPRPGVVEINYCREGRCECAFGAQSYCYMSAGDLSVCALQRGAHTSAFPTAHYHGVTVTIDFAGITAEMRRILELVSVDIGRIAALSGRQDFYMIRANAAVQRLFSELYAVREPLRQGYIRVKLLELLLLLTELDWAAGQAGCVYFSRAQRDCVRQAHDFMVTHLAERHTIGALAARFAISPTALKRCFKSMYGAPVYAYLRAYRLQAAERLLREGGLTVAQIAARVGYANPNKFTAAFCAVYGMPPTRYKKECPNG